jgi:hypothetical protein
MYSYLRYITPDNCIQFQLQKLNTGKRKKILKVAKKRGMKHTEDRHRKDSRFLVENNARENIVEHM